jgi:hypothetical protein
MSRSHTACRQSRAPAGRASASRRTRAVLSACVLAAMPLALALAAGPADAQPGSARQGSALPVSLAITSVSPAYATPGQTVTVRGLVTNTSAAAMSGMSVRLRSSSVSFPSRDALQEYADGNEPLADSYIQGAVRQIPSTLAPGATAHWTIRLPVAHVRMTSFGVYPLAAEADSASGAALDGGTSRTFLPYWPRKHGPDPRPMRQDIAWVWPLIDQPRQSECPGFPDNSLAPSLAAGGRLSSLLAAGAAQSASAQLPWAIDPALLADVEEMKDGPYRVGASAECTHSRQLPASHAAAAWLAGLLAATRGQPVFVTPYADVDIAALSRVSLDQDLASAFTEGRSVASKVLRRDFSLPAAQQSSQAAAQQLNGMAWPADGLANHAVLQNLAVSKITAVVLDSTMLPLAAGSPSFIPADAIASTPDGVDGDMRVLLSDDTITQILGTADAPSEPPATAFAVEQRFLAETAMIAAQAPNSSRAIVVAPPRRWAPPAGLAQGLLTETASAPWLQPVSLGRLAAEPAPPPVSLQPPPGSAKGGLSRHLLRKVKSLDRRAALLQSIRLHPDPQLGRAVAAVESSAWRGRAGRTQAQVLLSRLSDYIASQQSAVTIIAPLPVTLGGLKGTVPVSISNRLGYAVHVRLKVSVPSDGRFTSSPPPIETIPAQQVVNVKLKMRSTTVGSTTVSLSLLTPGGRALPGKPVAMTIRATHFGTLALVILAGALGVFMITSAARAMRQGHATRPRPGHAGSAAAAADDAERPEDAVAADSVVADHADQQRTADQRTADHTGTAGYHDPTEDTDEFARAPGWADQG